MSVFTHILPGEVDDLDTKAVEYLEEAEKFSLGYFSAKRSLNLAKVGHGLLFIIHENSEVIGCFYVDFRFTENGKSMTVTVGGKNLWSWKDEFSDFLHKLADSYGCAEFLMMGREGWGRIYPSLEHVACIYRKRLI